MVKVVKLNIFCYSFFYKDKPEFICGYADCKGVKRICDETEVTNSVSIQVLGAQDVTMRKAGKVLGKLTS